MERVSLNGCDCLRLTGDLEEGAPLPNHVCEITRRETCRRWLEHQLAPTRALEGAHRCVTTVPLGDGRFTLPIEDEAVWPVPVMGQEQVISVVLRQWVEEVPDPALGELLMQLPAWELVLRRLVAFRTEMPQDPGARLTWVSFILSHHGLPSTPGAAAYVLQQLAAGGGAPGDAGAVAGPTRGVCVISLGLTPTQLTGQAGRLAVNHGGMVSQVLAVSPWATDDLRRRAAAVAGRHAAWWRGLPDSKSSQLDRRRLNGQQNPELTALVERFFTEGQSEEWLYEAAIALERQEKGARTDEKAVRHRVYMRLDRERKKRQARNN